MANAADGTIPGLRLLKPNRFADDRGFFCETYDRAGLAAQGITDCFDRDAHVFSAKDVLRGLHYTVAHPHAKLVWVSFGAVWDVVVDLRPASPAFGRSFTTRLSGEDAAVLYLPPGVAHGYCVVGDGAHMHYKLAGPYDPADEAGVRWNDPALAIPWPVAAPLINARDAAWPLLAECRLPQAGLSK